MSGEANGMVMSVGLWRMGWIGNGCSGWDGRNMVFDKRTSTNCGDDKIAFV